MTDDDVKRAARTRAKILDGLARAERALFTQPAPKRAFCPGRSVWQRSAAVDDCGVLVHVEAVGQVADGRATVRVRSEVGAAAAFWCGDPTGVGREHHVEWTVEEDVAWGGNTRPATSSSPGVDEEEGGRIVFRGRLGLTGDGGAMLEVAGTRILFDLADPPPSTAVDGTWVEISVERNSVSLWPYLL